MTSPAELAERLARDGFALLDDVRVDPLRPWDTARQLLGEVPEMVEQQPIRPVAGGRTFAGSRAFTPFHTDSQDFLGAPPGIQVLHCVRAAETGGASRLLDGWALLDHLSRTDPPLLRALFETPRRHRFYFGDVTGPTVARRRGHLAWTHSPLEPEDDVGRALARVLGEVPVIERTIPTSHTLVVDNHRMLHGRRAFDGDARYLHRLLIWRPVPWPSPDRWRARSVAVPTASPMSWDDPDGRWATAVTRMIEGMPPARLSAELGVPEAVLYARRSAWCARSGGASR